MLVNENKNPSLKFLIRFYRLWNKIRDKFASALSVGTERKKELYIQLCRAATLKDLVYWLQILLSAGIATLGLVMNSPAVIIGAMLISPLMNPILAAGLAFATGDLILGIRAALSLILSSLVSVGFAFVLVALLPFKEQTSEILARTSPNTLDLVIALFSGAIGSIATAREVKGAVTSIPGVAIAVALMPPLCVIGYGIGLALTLNFNDGMIIARGGGLLYLTNLVAITFTAMIVLVMLRIDTGRVREKVREWRENDIESKWLCRIMDKIPALEHAREIRSFSIRLVMILLPMLLIIIPLTQSFSRLRTEIVQKQKENKIEQKARDLWTRYFAGNSNGESRSYLDELRIEDQDDKLNIFLRVFDNEPYKPEEKQEFVKMLASHLNRPVDSITLQMVEVPTSARKILEPKVESTPLPPTLSELRSNYLRAVEASLAGLKLPAQTRMLDYQISNSPNAESSIQVFYLSERDLSPDALDLMGQEIKNRLNNPNALVSFERVPAETGKIPFENGTAGFRQDYAGNWSEIGKYLRQHPRLKLIVKLQPPVNGNPNLLAERQNRIKGFLMQNWGVTEDRIIVEQTSDPIEADSFKIIFEQ